MKDKKTILLHTRSKGHRAKRSPICYTCGAVIGRDDYLRYTRFSDRSELWYHEGCEPKDGNDKSKNENGG